jgi:hypothetical protein
VLVKQPAKGAVLGKKGVLPGKKGAPAAASKPPAAVAAKGGKRGKQAGGAPLALPLGKAPAGALKGLGKGKKGKKGKQTPQKPTPLSPAASSPFSAFSASSGSSPRLSEEQLAAMRARVRQQFEARLRRAKTRATDVSNRVKAVWSHVGQLLERDEKEQREKSQAEGRKKRLDELLQYADDLGAMLEAVQTRDASVVGKYGRDDEFSESSSSGSSSGPSEEGRNTPFCPLQEKFHTFVLRGLINISEAP